MYVDNLLDGYLWRISFKRLEVEIWNLLGWFVSRTSVQIEFVYLRSGYSALNLLTFSILLLKVKFRRHWEALIWWRGAGAATDGVGGEAPSGIGGRALVEGLGAEPTTNVWGRAPTLCHFMVSLCFLIFIFNCFVMLLACLESFRTNFGPWSDFCPFTE